MFVLASGLFVQERGGSVPAALRPHACLLPGELDPASVVFLELRLPELWPRTGRFHFRR